MRKFFTAFIALLAICVIAYGQQCSPPVITSFSPTTAYIGSTVTITGANFDPIPANNQVFFGSTKATIISATFSSLEVRVPVGATYAPISIKNNCGLYGVSKEYFNGIFCGTQITNTTYNTVSYSQPVSGGYQMISQDIDLDGKPDILITGYAANSISVVRNLSTAGSVAFAAELRLPTNGPTRCIAPGDFDGDGKVDLAVTVTGAGIYIFKNNSTPGSLSFAAPVIYNTSSIGTWDPYQMAAGDLNGDGKLDLAFGAFDATIRTLRNTSSGSISFSPGNTINNTYAVYGIAIADIDNDGVKDIATSCGANDMVSALRNTTTAGNTSFTFQNPSFYPTNSGLPYRMFIGDFDKDGKIDLASNNHSGGTVSIFRNTSNIGTISFAPRVNLLSPSSNYRIGIGDADGDGSPDIVTKSSGENVFSVYKNTSGGAGSISFATRVDYPGQAEVSGVVIADFDGDYVPDIATSGISYNTLRVHRNTSTVVDKTPPTAICRNITVPLGTNGKVTVTPQMIDNGSGDACGIAALTINDQPSIELTCNNEGRNTVTLKVTDRAGNSSACTAVVTVAPAAVIVAGQTTVCQGQTVALSANEGDTYQWAKNGVDIPGATSRNYIATESGSYTVAVTNGGGCSGTSAPVQITVNNNPTVSTLPSGTVAMCNGSAALSASTSSIYQWKLNGNNIGGATQQSYNATAPGTYSVTVVDLFGCSATSDPIEVTNINQPPTALCKSALTVNLEANGTVSITAASINNGSFDNCGTVSLSITSGKTSFTCSDIGQTFDVELTVTDKQGATSTCITKVTVADPNSYCNVAPVALCKPLTVSADNSCQGVATASDFDGGSTDDDGDVMTFSVFPAGPYAIGTTQVTLTVSDPSGASSSCTTTITVVDDKAPTITAPAPIKDHPMNAGQCFATVALGTPMVADNCGVKSVINDAPATFPVGTTTVTWTVTDIHNNTTTAVQEVTVVDNQQPVITTNGNKRVVNDAGLCGALVDVSASATDNCSVGAPVGVRKDGKALDALFPVGTTTITWTVTDANGVAADPVVQTVIVADTEKPVITTNGHKVVTNDAGACGAFVAVSATAKDNCSVGDPVGVREDGAALDALFPVGTTTITWTVTDMHNNTQTAIQTITITDNEKPVITTNSDQEVSNDPGQCGARVTVSATATDNCSVGAPSGVRSDNKELNDPYPVGTTTITWTVTDIHGNTQTATQTVTVTDTEKPTLDYQPIVYFCHNATGIYSLPEPTGSDNCGKVTISSNAPATFTAGTKVVTWTGTDIHGNSASYDMTVVINQPITVSIPSVKALNYPGVDANTVYLGYAPATALTLTATATGGDGMYRYSWSPVSGSANSIVVSPTKLGENYFTVKVTDGFDGGKCSAEQTVTITVTDARCGGDLTKVNMCHVTNANDPTHVKTICIDGGSVEDHLKKGCRLDACLGSGTVTSGVEVETLASGFTLKAMPNPSTAYFTLKVESSNITDKVSLRVLDVKGRLVEARNHLQPNQTLRIGDSYRPGIYFIEVIQGAQRSQTKLIKLSH